MHVAKHTGFELCFASPQQTTSTEERNSRDLRLTEVTYEQLYDLLDIHSEKEDEYDFMAGCPVHGSSDSLHVWIDDDDSLGVHCFTCGANVVEVGKALGLLDGEPDEDEEPPAVTISRRKREAEEVVDPGRSVTWGAYAEEKQLDLERLRTVLPVLGALEPDDEILFPFPDGTAKRRTAKSFDWTNGGKAKKTPLWPDPAPEEAMPETIYITEGETDCLTLRMAGFPAYAITGGANEKGVLSVGRFVGLRNRGVRTVVLCNDADEAGLGWDRAEALNVMGARLQVGQLDLSPFYDAWGTGCKDVNELWCSCETAEEFLELVEQCTRIEERKDTLKLDDIWELADEEIEYLVSELVSPHEKGLIVGREKTYKTWIALSLLRAVATGSSFLNREDWSAEAGDPVLLVEEEGSKHKFAQRVKHVFADVSDKHRENFHLWFRHAFRLTDDDQVSELIAYVREHGIRLVVLDPLQRMMPGVEENSNSETGAVWDNIHRISQECAVVVIHHANKQGMDWRQAIRGASRTGGEIDFVMYIQPGEIQGELKMHLDGRDLVKLEDQQGYLAIKFPPTEPWAMDGTGWKLDLNTNGGKKAAASQGKILEALADGDMTVAQLLDATGLSRPTLERQLDKLAENGLISSAKGPRNAAIYTLEGED